MIRLTKRQLRSIIKEETTKQLRKPVVVTRSMLRQLMSEAMRATPETIEALRAFADRFGYIFSEADPDTGLSVVSDAPFEGHEIVWVDEDGQVLFGFADGARYITLEELREMTDSGTHPPTEFDS